MEVVPCAYLSFLFHFNGRIAFRCRSQHCCLHNSRGTSHVVVDVKILNSYLNLFNQLTLLMDI